MTKTKERSLPEKYKVVADIIRVGKRNATLLSDIMNVAHIKDERQAYIIIENLINKHGYPIVASRKGKYRGYYYPANKSEFDEARETFESSIISMQKRYNNLIKNYYIKRG